MSYVARSRYPGAYNRRFVIGRPARRRIPYGANRRAQFQAQLVRMRVPRAAPARLNTRTAGFLGIEKKFFDCGITGAAVIAPTNAAGAEVDPATLLCLNCPAQADGPQSRDGRKITMDSIQVVGNVLFDAQIGAATPDTGCNVVIFLVLDTQTNAAQLNSEDVFVNPTAATLLAASPFHELENGARFRVLSKQRLHLPALPISGVAAASTIVQSGSILPFEMFVDLKGMEVNYDKDVTTSVIAAIRDNSLHLVAFADNVAVAPNLSYNSRLRFRG